MKITLKLYAGLSAYLPAAARHNAVELEIAKDSSAHDIMDHCRLPWDKAHLVLRNGFYIEPRDRDRALFSDGDTVAMWPPVAGG